MKNLILLWPISLALIACFSARPSVRNLTMNDAKMEAIFTTPGMSTVLRFPEKPGKIVAGNLNAFEIEFVENDVTIRPKGHHSTNLFVYTSNNTYGFLLTVSRDRKIHDDLVIIWWKPKKSERYALARPGQTKNLEIPSVLSAKVVEIKKIENGFIAVSITLKNQTSNNIRTGDIRLLLALRNGKKLSPQKAYFKTAFLKPDEETQVKLISVFKGKMPFVLTLFYKGQARRLRLDGVRE